jgi:Cu/Ag efflux protein CusF
MFKLKNARFAATIALVALVNLAHAQAPDPELSQGEVRKIDKAKASITLQHGPLDNLDMPGMTMSFKVADRALLDTLRTGDKIRFRAERVDGQFVVTRVEPAQ